MAAPASASAPRSVRPERTGTRLARGTATGHVDVLALVRLHRDRDLRVHEEVLHEALRHVAPDRGFAPPRDRDRPEERHPDAPVGRHGEVTGKVRIVVDADREDVPHPHRVGVRGCAGRLVGAELDGDGHRRALHPDGSDGQPGPLEAHACRRALADGAHALGKPRGRDLGVLEEELDLGAADPGLHRRCRLRKLQDQRGGTVRSTSLPAHRGGSLVRAERGRDPRVEREDDGDRGEGASDHTETPSANPK
jgi:hypothetical protein